MTIFGTLLLSMILAAGTSGGALIVMDISWIGGIVLYLVLASLFAVVIASARMVGQASGRRRDDGKRKINMIDREPLERGTGQERPVSPQ